MLRNFILLVSTFCVLSSCVTEEKKKTSEYDIDEPENNPIIFSTGVQAVEAGGCHTEFGFVPEGATIMAYPEPQVILPKNCVPETRICNSGTLSGSAPFLSCLEVPAE